MEELPNSVDEPQNEATRIRLSNRLFRLMIVVAAGMLYAAALPPLNLSFLAGITLLPLICYAVQERWYRAALAGWLWGIGWSLPAFWFLREIEWAIPFGMAPVISLWPALFAALLPAFWKLTLFPWEIARQGYEVRRRYLATEIPYARLLFFSLGCAALFTLIEWTRSRLFTWNSLDVTMWRNVALIQLAAFTGSYGVGFVIAWFNTALFCAAATNFRRAGLRVLLTAMLLLALVHVGGMIRIFSQKPEPPNWFPTLIQGDLSQRRHSTTEQAIEALDIYTDLTRQAIAASPKPDIILWPESAIPLLFRAAHPISARFRNEIATLTSANTMPMLIGAIDFEDAPGLHPGITNSALFFNAKGRIRRKYDKIHRVPFGEYIPFRKFLPTWLTSRIDMGRDLVPGTNFNPIDLENGVRAGTAICFEGVFGYINRNFARRGANVLVVLSNDAWYPKSSEPEQHLANAVIRAVETGLSMVRNGNNGGSGVVTPTGVFTQCLEVPGPEKRPELRRGRGFTRIGVYVPENPPGTFYLRYGEWFIGLLAIIVGIWSIAAIAEYRKRICYFHNHKKQQDHTDHA